MPQIAGMLKDISRESLVILYTPSVDRSFSMLMQQANRVIEIATAGDLPGPPLHRSLRSSRFRENLPYTQQTLEVL